MRSLVRSAPLTATEASRIAGEPVVDVDMVVPATAGPRWRTWLRHAGHNGGLHVRRLVEAPVAAAALLAPPRSATSTLPGRTLLVIDIGAGCETTVLREGPQRFEVLATMTDREAGGDRIDAALVQTLAGTSLDELSADQQTMTLANVRAARQALSDQVAVTLALPQAPAPVVVNAVQVAQVAQPILERVGETVANADLELADIHGVHLIGGVAMAPGAGEQIAAKLGVVPQVPPWPAFTAVSGLAGPGPSVRDEAASPLPIPPLRRLLYFALPAALSLLLYTHFVLRADVFGAVPMSGQRGDVYELTASWPELTTACLIGLIALVQAASLVAALLQAQTSGAASSSPNRIPAALGIAATASVVIAYLYALAAAAYFVSPTDWILRWSIRPLWPVALCVVVLAFVAWRRQSTPPGGWDAFLTFPLISLITSTVGTLIITVWAIERLPYWFNGWRDTLAYAGILLISIGAVSAVVRHLVARIGLSLLLSLFLIVITLGGIGSQQLGIVYTVTVALWILKHTWALTHVPPAAQR